MDGQAINDFYKNLIFPRNTAFKVPHTFEINNSAGNYTPAMKMMLMNYVDPLALNFKVMLNPYQQTGLLAGADKIIFDTGPNQDLPSLLSNDSNFPTDSALAFLIRIGETSRAKLLARWIQVFFDLIRNYEFLVIDVEGLEDVLSKSPHASYNDAKIKINFRETSDSRVQSLIANYNEIWYDNTLNHVILPSNLISIDMSILVFNAGYYNESRYGKAKTLVSPNDVMESQMFPTISKLNKVGNYRWLESDGQNPPPFIYHMFTFGSSSINVEDTGLEYFSSVSNDPGNTDPVKTSLVFNFGGCKYSNCSTNTFGYLDIPQMMITMTRLANVMDYDVNGRIPNPYESIFTDKIFNSWGARFKDSWKGLGDNLLNTAMNLSKKYVESTRMWADNIANSVITLTDPALLRNITERSLVKLMSKADSEMYELFRIRDVNNFMRTNLSDRALKYWYDYESYLLSHVNRSVLFPKDSNQLPFGSGLMENPEKPVRNGSSVSFEPNDKNEADSGVNIRNIQVPIEENNKAQLFNGVQKQVFTQIETISEKTAKAPTNDISISNRRNF